MQQHNINNTQRIITAMELNQSFPINSISVHGDSSPVLCFALFLLSMLMLNNNNDTKEGAYILFALSNFGTINSTINFYLPALKLLNAFLSILQYKCARL